MKRTHLGCSSVYLALVCAAFLVLPATNVKAAVLSGLITNPANGHHYSLLDTATWTASEAEAIALGGHLVTINDGAEGDFVVNTFAPLLPATPGATLWIGLNDAAQEGNFVWASGEPVTFTNWLPSQPDNFGGTEHYVQMLSPADAPKNPELWSMWNDLPNDRFGEQAHGVVAVAVPEPSNWALFTLGVLSVWASRSYTHRKKVPAR